MKSIMRSPRLTQMKQMMIKNSWMNSALFFQSFIINYAYFLTSLKTPVIFLWQKRGSIILDLMNTMFA